MPSNCVIYRRYSTDEQGGKQGQTLKTQLDTCTEFARRQGWTVTEVLTDDGCSAYKGEHLKPGADLYGFVQRIERDEIESGTILLAYNPSRLSRLEPDKIMAWVHNTLTSRGFGLAFANKEKVFKANPGLEEHIGMVLAFAQTYGESADKSRNIRNAKNNMWGSALNRQGEWTNLAARHPAWLDRTARRDDWDVNDQADVVRDIYQWSADGLGASAIAARLNKVGIEPWGTWHKKSKTWCRTSIRQILTTPSVEGDLVPKTGMFKGQKIIGFFPRIVDADLVAKARAQQATRSKKHKNEGSKTGTISLFAGLTFCGECGQRAFVTSNVSKKTGKQYRYLRCEAAGDQRDDCKNLVYYPFAAFEEAALDLCLDLALDDRFFEATGDLRKAQVRKAELKKVVADKSAQRERMLSDYYASPSGDLLLKQMTDRLGVEIDELQAELAEVTTALHMASGKVDAVEHLRRVNDIREAAKSEDPMVREQARAKLRLAFSAIVAGVDVSRHEGTKVFTLSFIGGVLAVRIDEKGRVLKGMSDAGGKPLYEYLSEDQRRLAEPLIKRIEARAA